MSCSGPLDEDPQRVPLLLQRGHGLFVLLPGLFAPLLGAQAHEPKAVEHQATGDGQRQGAQTDLPVAQRQVALL